MMTKGGASGASLARLAALCESLHHMATSIVRAGMKRQQHRGGGGRMQPKSECTGHNWVGGCMQPKNMRMLGGANAIDWHEGYSEHQQGTGGTGKLLAKDVFKKQSICCPGLIKYVDNRCISSNVWQVEVSIACACAFTSTKPCGPALSCRPFQV